MKIAEMLVQDGERHDDALHMESAPVNMRLFKDMRGYRYLIYDIVKHLKFVAEHEFEDYPEVQGISGANVGVPFNIVIVITKDGAEIFLNPTIIGASEEMVSCNSNCGSLNLPKKVKIMRHRWVIVEYYDMVGEKHVHTFRIGDGDLVSSATLQHEIEHNLGILVTDKG